MSISAKVTNCSARKLPLSGNFRVRYAPSTLKRTPSRTSKCCETHAISFLTTRKPQYLNQRVSSSDTDILMRLAAFERVKLLSKMHDHLTQEELRSGFEFNNQRVPLVNP